MFSLRKINSVLIIPIILLLAYHALLSGLCLAELIEYTPNMALSGVLLLTFLIIHIIISLYLFVKDRNKRGKIRAYDYINKEKRFQAFSGIFLIIFIFAHILSYIYLPAYISNFYWHISHFIIDILLFIALYIHLELSILRSLVSFGFLVEKKDYNNCRIFVRIILAIIFIFLAYSELSYYIL